MTELFKLNLGCGSDIRKGWVNIDSWSNGKDGIYPGDIRCLEKFQGKTEYIYANHIIEHLSFRDIDAALAHWNEVLIDGGIIELACPNLETELENYRRTGNYSKLQLALWGDQRRPLDYHLNGFTPTILKQKLESAGFEIVSMNEKSIKGLEVIAKKRVLNVGKD